MAVISSPSSIPAWRGSKSVKCGSSISKNKFSSHSSVVSVIRKVRPVTYRTGRDMQQGIFGKELKSILILLFFSITFLQWTTLFQVSSFKKPCNINSYYFCQIFPYCPLYIVLYIHKHKWLFTILQFPISICTKLF